MPKKLRQGPLSNTLDKTGPRGPRRPRGAPGRQGERGPQGKRGERGATDPISVARKVIADLQQSVEMLRSESNTQLERIAQLQAQLDLTLANFHKLQQGQKGRSN